MTQPLDLITSALTSIGALAPGEPLDPALAQDAFNMLNDMLDVWSNDDFMVISTAEIVAQIGGGGTTWTIGPGGMINAVRPLLIKSAFVRVNSIDYPVSVLTIDQYEQISQKQMSGAWPTSLYYNSGTPLGTLSFYPNPSAGEIHMFTNQQFGRFVTINDTVEFTPGYNMAIRWSLAELLMPGYGKTDPALTGMVRANAIRAVASLKGTNTNPMQTVQFDTALSPATSNNAGWINNGGFTQ